MRSRRTISGISVLVLIAAIIAGFGTPAPALGATDLRLCGRVNAYVAPTALLAGTLTVGHTTLLIKAGTDLPSQVEVGANLCFNLELDLAGRITDSTVTANVTSSLELCGAISAYSPADATSTGGLQIGTVDLVLAAGSQLPAAVRVGADLCLDLTLNGFGQVSGGSAQANASNTLRICGTVTNLDRATVTDTGRLTIGPRTFVLGVGSSLPAAVRAGANLCMRLTINALGQVSGGSAQANVTSSVDVCGQVNAFAAAAPTADGRLTIDSVPRAIAAGTTVSSAVRAGAFVHLRLALDAFGRITDDAVLAAGASLAAVCGMDTPPDASGSANPSPSPAPSDGTPSPAPSGGSGGGGGTAGSGSSASPAAGDGGSAAEQGDCSPADGSPAAAPAAGAGGPIPDTASLGRAGRVIGLMALPLLMLMLLVIGYLAIQSRRGFKSSASGAGDGGAGEVAP